jgi:hypothetical protein
MLDKLNTRKYILKETVTKEEAPANSVAGGGVDMAPNAKRTKIFMKRKKLDGRSKEYREAARRIKERKDKLHQKEVEAKLGQFGITAMESTTMDNNNKYLETKPGSIEDAVLNALNPNTEKETLTLPKTDEEDIVEYINSDGSHRRCAGGDGRRVENKAKPKNKKEIEETEVTEGSKEEYQKFFQAALKKFGAKSPAEMDDEKKKKFFNYIEKNWTQDEQKDLTTKIKEGRVSFRIFRENSKKVAEGTYIGGPKETFPKWIGGVNSKTAKAIKKALSDMGHAFDDHSNVGANKKNNTHYISMRDKKGLAALEKIKKKMNLSDNPYGTPGYNKSKHKGKADKADLPKHVKHDSKASYMEAHEIGTDEYANYAKEMTPGEDAKLDELSNKTMDSYAKKATASQADAEKKGNYKKADKRMAGKMRASRRKFSNDTNKILRGLNK